MAALQPSNALWRGFEFAHRANSTKSFVSLLLWGWRLWLSPMSVAALINTLHTAPYASCSLNTKNSGFLKAKNSGQNFFSLLPCCQFLWPSVPNWPTSDLQRNFLTTTIPLPTLLHCTFLLCTPKSVANVHFKNPTRPCDSVSTVPLVQACSRLRILSLFLHSGSP